MPEPAPALAEPAPKPIDDRPGLVELLVTVGLVWSATLLMGTAVAVITIARGQPIDPFAPLPLVALSCLDQGVTLVVSVTMLCLVRRRGFRGLGMRPIGGRALAACAIVSIAAALLASFVPEGDSLMAKLASRSEGREAIAVIAVTAPAIEEIYYRGLIQPALTRLLGGRIAVAIVILWFAGVHAFQLAGDWIALAFVAALGTLWTLQRHLSGSLTPSLVTHFSYNAALLLLPAHGP